jgi:hypothetical protein
MWQAMSDASLEPLSLDLALDIVKSYCFLTSTSHKVLSRVLRRVERLTLQNRCTLTGPEQRTLPNFTPPSLITKATCSSLHFLKVEADREHGSWGTGALPLPPREDIPGLERITLLGGNQSDPGLIAFLGLFSSTIRSISLCAMIEYNHEPILRALHSLKLDELSIHDRYEQWRDGQNYGPEGRHGIPRGLLGKIAQRIILGPQEA